MAPVDLLCRAVRNESSEPVTGFDTGLLLDQLKQWVELLKAACSESQGEDTRLGCANSIRISVALSILVASSAQQTLSDPNARASAVHSALEASLADAAVSLWLVVLTLLQVKICDLLILFLAPY